MDILNSLKATDTVDLAPPQYCHIFVEIGAMYESIEGMKKLIRLSRKAGVDGVKIQTFQAAKLALPGAEFELSDGRIISQYDFFKKYEISKKNHRILFDYAKKQNILLFSTPSHVDDVDFLEELGTPLYKTGSDDLTNYPFLKYIGKMGKPVILSTGMSTIAEIEEAVKTIIQTGNKQITLMQCTTSYPSKPEHANLNVMQTLKKAFGFPVGYSDHIPGIFPSVLAASMGASIIEKHITLDRNLQRPDHEVSIEPDELENLVKQVRMIPKLQGSSVKTVSPDEERWRINARKSLVSAKRIKAGGIFSHDNIKIMRPGTGIHPRHIEFIIGKPATREIPANQLILKDMF